MLWYLHAVSMRGGVRVSTYAVSIYLHTLLPTYVFLSFFLSHLSLFLNSEGIVRAVTVRASPARPAVGFIRFILLEHTGHTNNTYTSTKDNQHKMNDTSTKKIPPRVDDALTKAARVSRGGDRGGRSGQYGTMNDPRHEISATATAVGVGPLLFNFMSGQFL